MASSALRSGSGGGWSRIGERSFRLPRAGDGMGLVATGGEYCVAASTVFLTRLGGGIILDLSVSLRLALLRDRCLSLLP